jgi:hypothetical protein
MEAMHYFKLILFTFGSAFLLYRGVEDYMIARQEKAPKPVSLDYWHADYRGELWIAVTARFAGGRAVMTSQTNEGGGRVFTAFVPLLPTARDDDAPVRAVAVITSRSATDLVAALRPPQDGAGLSVVSGMVAPPGGHFANRLPNEDLASDVVFIYAGESPGSPTTAIIIIALGGGLSLFCAFIIQKHVRVLREQRRRRRASG